MKRFLAGLAVAVTVGLVVASPVARAQTPSELRQTARYAAAFQNPDGGFGARVGGASTLGSTSSAVRILKYTGGSIPDVLGCIKFVKSCYDAEAGGFAPTPGGKSDVGTTASGLMAMSELKIVDEAKVDKAVQFLAKNAKTFEEVRIAVAGFEAVKRPTPDVAAWEALVKQNRNPDGTFSQGPALAVETGGRAVALLRMGVELDRKPVIVESLKAAQRPDGVWSGSDGKPDLGSTYRIMRFFFMAKEKPDLDRLRGFLAKCRQSDGGYGPQPGAEASLGTTYFASIMLYWSRLLDGEPAVVETAGFQLLFNGKDLTGWEGDTALWSARNGVLVGSSPGLKHNDFLAQNGTWNSFVLRLNFQLVGGSGNSGVQFRSVRIPGHEMSGYQADIGPNYWGCLYDESRRNRVLAPASENALKALHKTDWNQYVVDAKGADVRLFLNGTEAVKYQETDPAIAREGRIAVQIHGGGPMEVRFKDIYIQPLPEPNSDTEATPGFHLRTVKTAEGERKYTLYLPKGYDGKKTFPVVLFLHGSGERGSDGVKQAQTGLGPAIFNNPDGFPAIAVFPQARQTWSAGSDDAKAALATLDEVLRGFKSDPKRVILTGLSMGGRGSSEIAAENPERFAAVVQICGTAQSTPERVKAIATLPLWTVVGDADRDQTVLGLRSLVEGVTAAGGKAHLTEYRGVGHNSWDRAYNDATLIDWMLAQARR
jgi:poly(3-hydroxybutyrate) depolymerase/prenyltransferase beta subunit